jgi:hypothetical protein
MINIKNCICVLLLILFMLIFASYSQSGVQSEQRHSENSASEYLFENSSFVSVKRGGLPHLLDNAETGFSYCYNYQAQSYYADSSDNNLIVTGFSEIFQIEDAFKEIRKISFLFDDAAKSEDNTSLYIWNAADAFDGNK